MMASITNDMLSAEMREADGSKWEMRFRSSFPGRCKIYETGEDRNDQQTL